MYILPCTLERPSLVRRDQIQRLDVDAPTRPTRGRRALDVAADAAHVAQARLVAQDERQRVRGRPRAQQLGVLRLPAFLAVRRDVSQRAAPALVPGVVTEPDDDVQAGRIAGVVVQQRVAMCAEEPRRDAVRASRRVEARQLAQERAELARAQKRDESAVGSDGGVIAPDGRRSDGPLRPRLATVVGRDERLERIAREEVAQLDARLLGEGCTVSLVEATERTFGDLRLSRRVKVHARHRLDERARRRTGRIPPQRQSRPQRTAKPPADR